MLQEILRTRLMVKRSIKIHSKESDAVLRRVLDARQLALKMIANVTYGYTAAGFSGRMPMAELADAIVQCGRTTLEWTISRINSHPDWRAEVVYGDTDSVFVHLRGRSKAEAFTIGEQIAADITQNFPPEVVLKFEKVYLPCALVSKKRYVGYAFESPDDALPRFDAKGIEVVRRDQCMATCKIQEKALRILFDTKDLSLVKSFLHEQWTKMHQGGSRLPLRDFIFRKEVRLGKYAKNPLTGEARSLPPGAIVACKHMALDPRAEPPYKWRVPYVVVAGPPQAALKDLVVSPEEVLGRDGGGRGGRGAGDGLRINHIYYITKHILPALERVLNFSGIDVRGWYRQMAKPSATWRRDLLLDPAVMRSVCDICSVTVDNSAAPVAAAENANAWKGQGRQATITQFMREEVCVTCGCSVQKSARRSTTIISAARSNEANEAGGLQLVFADMICEQCSAKPAGVWSSITARLKAVEERQQALRVVCCACAGHSQIEDLFLAGPSMQPQKQQEQQQRGRQTLLGADCCVSLDCPVFHERRRGVSRLEDARLLAFVASVSTSLTE